MRVRDVELNVSDVSDMHVGSSDRTTWGRRLLSTARCSR